MAPSGDAQTEPPSERNSDAKTKSYASASITASPASTNDETCWSSAPSISRPPVRVHPCGGSPTARSGAPMAASRSEEHTSELQSRGHLVCRLLLEKTNSYSTSHSA